MRVDNAVGFACNGRAHDVRNGDGPGTPLLGLTQGAGSVGCLAGLGNKDTELARPDGWITIFELARVVNVHVHTGEFLRHELTRNAGVSTGPRSNDVDASHSAEIFGWDLDPLKAHQALFERDARLNRPPQPIRLFANLTHQA